MEPWVDACQHDNIENTPLNPFIDQVCLGYMLSVTGKLHQIKLYQVHVAISGIWTHNL
jgi:hypothetical protein